jgi:3,4-dihydroxy 2-butanone 4-phosphate synthase/GTP cyclohydrolase II
MRDYGIGAQILRDLGVGKMRLMTNNPRKRSALQGFGLEEVETIPLTSGINQENQRYLETKRDKMGHLLPQDLMSIVNGEPI